MGKVGRLLVFVGGCIVASVFFSILPSFTRVQRQRGKVILVSHRSCSDDQNAHCNAVSIQKLNNLSRIIATKYSDRINEKYIYTYLPEEIRNDPKWSTHIVPGLRGRGYWFWKPAIMNMLIRTGVVSDGDNIIYMDGDFESAHIDHLIEAGSRRHESGAMFDVQLFFQRHCEYTWTKGDVFAKFGVNWTNPHYGMTRQARGGSMHVYLTSRSRQLLQFWEDLASDYHLISDERSTNTSVESHLFMDNRHDQSLLSMLIKASIPSPGPCDPASDLVYIPSSKKHISRPKLGRAKEQEEGWNLHPHFGIDGLLVNIW